MTIDANGPKSSDRTVASGGVMAPTATEPSRALVALTPAAPSRQAARRYGQAPFLAQLLAAKDRHPQTCARRRATPQDAIAAYLSAARITR